MVADDGERSDLLQDVWLTALRSSPAGLTSPRGWLRRVCGRLAQRRKSDRNEVPGDSGLSSDIGSPEEIVRWEETRRVLVDALLTLSSGQRQTLILHFFHGQSVNEIATSLGVPIETVRTRMKRGLAELRRRLESGFGGRREFLVAVLPLAAIQPLASACASTQAVTALSKYTGAITMVLKQKILIGVAASLVAVATTLCFLWATNDGESGLDDKSSRARGSDVANEARRSASSEEESPADVGEVEDGAAPPTDAAPTPIDRDRDLFGIVVDESGQPLPGAKVECFRLSNRFVATSIAGGAGRSRAIIGSELTDDRGKFAFRGKRAEQLDLIASCEGFAVQELTHCMAGEKLRIEMRAASQLSIAVVDEDQRPLPGVRLVVLRRDERRPSAPDIDRREGVTDADGRWEVGDLAAGSVLVESFHRSLFATPAQQKVDLDPDQPQRVEFEMVPGRRIVGRVIDEETGKPIEGAEIGYLWVRVEERVWAGSRSSVRAESDNEGRFSVSVAGRVDRLRIWGDAPGYARKETAVDEAPSVEISLAPADRVVGRVVDQERNPVSGAMLTTIASADGQSIVERRSASTGDDGRFEIDSVSRNLKHLLMIQKPDQGFLLDGFSTEDAKSGMIDLGDLVMKASAAIEGRVESHGGEPFDGATVTLEYVDSSEMSPASREVLRQTGYDFELKEVRRSDDLGRFRFPDMAPGNYRIRAASRGATTVTRELELTPDGERDLVIRFEGDATLDLIAITESRDPVADFPFWVNAEYLDEPIFARTNAKGVAQVGGLKELASVHVSHHMKKYVGRNRWDIVPGETSELVVTLTAAVTIKGQAFRSPGVPWSGTFVKVISDREPRWDVHTNSKGQFTVSLKEGELVDLEIKTSSRHEKRLVARATGLRGPSEITMTAEEIPATGSIRIQVLDPDGEAAAGVRVDCAPHTPFFGGPPVGSPKSSRIAGGVTDTNGRLELEGLSQEGLSFIAEARIGRDELRSAARNALPDGGNLILGLRRRGLLQGTVFGVEGEPCAGANVWVNEPRGLDWRTKSDAKGRFVLAVPIREHYTVSASGPSGPIYLRTEGEAQDIKSGATSVEIRLHRE